MKTISNGIKNAPVEKSTDEFKVERLSNNIVSGFKSVMTGNLASRNGREQFNAASLKEIYSSHLETQLIETFPNASNIDKVIRDSKEKLDKLIDELTPAKPQP